MLNDTRRFKSWKMDIYIPNEAMTSNATGGISAALLKDVGTWCRKQYQDTLNRASGILGSYFETSRVIHTQCVNVYDRQATLELMVYYSSTYIMSDMLANSMPFSLSL
jgi:hypothetical protein